MKIFRILYFMLFFSNVFFAQTNIILEKLNELYLVPCLVNGLNMKFIFDTGATDVSISLRDALIMYRNGALHEEDVIGPQYYKMANGEIEEGTQIILREIEIGGSSLRNIRASIIHRLEAPLLLGQSALEKLGSFSFDYSRNILTIYNTESQNKTFGCVEGDCFNGIGTMVYSNGNVYTGSFTEGRMDGRGVHLWPNGTKYVGEFKDDFIHGYGNYLWPEGTEYDGEFKNNVRHGFGVYYEPNGGKYEGEFYNGAREGYGKYTYYNGDKYDGYFRNNKRNGKGTYTWPNGMKYVGESKNDKWDGYGTFTWPDGKKYEGQFIDGNFHGYGKITYSDGTVYEGFFENNLYNGRGTLTYPNGTIQSGNFKNGKYQIK